MAEQQVIDAEIRDPSQTGKNEARRLRRAGKVPAVLYGSNAATVPLTLQPRQVASMLRSQSGRNTIFSLRVKDGETVQAMLVETQRDPVRESLLHVDLKRIAMDKKLRASVPVVTAGEPQGVKVQGGILEVVLREVEIECLPADIPDRVTVSVEPLLIGQNIRVADLAEQLGDRIRIVSELQGVICHVVAPKAVEEKPAAEAAAEAPAEPEVIKKGKAEEAEEAEPSAKAEKHEKQKKE